MDDDGLLLNLADDDTASFRLTSGKKGGRWTDRVKAKRVNKRRVQQALSKGASTSTGDSNTRPAKKPRLEHKQPEKKPIEQSRPPTQVISSLFTHNPKVAAPTQNTIPKTISKPSNAPLDDSSFSSLGVDPLIVAHLNTKMNIQKPTSIQRAVLSSLLLAESDAESTRDVFIQSQTGSGKTLAFLLAVLQDLLPLSSHSYIDRSIGTLAIIIAPTRELAKQISDVLDDILKMRLRPAGEAEDEEAGTSKRLTRWLVSGLLIGGATRTHEKARLRKGLPILVSTPGRLLDHLQNTSSFNVGKCRWLILDEADRLMELGFEETITGIIKSLDGRRRLARQAVKEGRSMEISGRDWDRRRRTILCSATIREDVQKLAGTVLVHPLVIKATNSDLPIVKKPYGTPGTPAPSEKFIPPTQLAQKYVVVPLKLRLVTLVALLRSLLAQGGKSMKIIVFLSCTDSVDFHWRLFGGVSMGEEKSGTSEDSSDDDASANGYSPPDRHDDDIERKSPLLPGTSVFRLHGSLQTSTRLASIQRFSTAREAQTVSTSSILLCSSVASRGLDLPLVRAVIQYDLPTEGGVTEYVHRVGRTARAGKGGEAWAFVAPSETRWVKWAESKMKDEVDGDNKQNGVFQPVAIESVLESGFGGKDKETEARATEVQLAFERWVLRQKEHSELARNAFLSHMRAYATHPAAVKHIFHIRDLHLGHLAKSFALRESPVAAAAGHAKNPSRRYAKSGATEPRQGKRERNTDKRMQEAVRSQGRLLKKGGVMTSSDTTEFQIASSEALERLVNR